MPRQGAGPQGAAESGHQRGEGLPVPVRQHAQLREDRLRAQILGRALPEVRVSCDDCLSHPFYCLPLQITEYQTSLGP